MSEKLSVVHMIVKFKRINSQLNVHCQLVQIYNIRIYLRQLYAVFAINKQPVGYSLKKNQRQRYCIHVEVYLFMLSLFYSHWKIAYSMY